jgi:hypothetical protein
VACLVFQLLKLVVLSKLFLNEPPFYGSAKIFETQDAMEWPIKKFGNTASVLACIVRSQSTVQRLLRRQI